MAEKIYYNADLIYKTKKKTFYKLQQLIEMKIPVNEERRTVKKYYK